MPITPLVLAALLTTAVATAPTEPVEIEIARVNGEWKDLDGGLKPIEQGPMTLLVEVPEHALTVHENRLRLGWVERDAGTVDVEFEARMEGWGQLLITLQTATGSTPFDDRVVAKTQWVKAGAVVRLGRLASSYRLEVVVPHRPAVGIQIESELAAQMVGTCRSLAAFPMFGAVDCDALSASMARVEIPMPEPGTVYFLRDDLFSDAERAVLDAFVTPIPETGE
ncbi:MAG: hypothetical protein AAGE94_22310 [Acidobacteriota bacterium]